MRAALVGTIMACAVGAAMPALADVKAGVDAWQQGDYARAVAEWRPLAQAGDPDAQFNLGQAYKLGRGVPVDLPVAMEWFRKAAAQGHERASDNYGLLLFQQGRRQDAMPYIRASADRGEPRAQYILGTALFNGDLAPKDWVTAYALMSRAAAAGLDQAKASLATMDNYISADERQKALALSERMASGAEAASVPTPAPAQRVTPRVAGSDPRRQPPRPIASAPVPPSEVTPAEPAGPPAPPQGSAAPPPQAAPPATPAPVAGAPPRTGKWRVQMGAFREEPRARALWGRITGRLPMMESYQPYLVRDGTLTRLQAGPIASEADAARLCGRLRAEGYDCLVRRRPGA